MAVNELLSRNPQTLFEGFLRLRLIRYFAKGVAGTVSLPISSVFSILLFFPFSSLFSVFFRFILRKKKKPEDTVRETLFRNPD